MNNYAAIDIGTNAMRILFAEAYRTETSKVKLLRSTFIRMPIRLGIDVFKYGNISKEKEDNLVKILATYKTLIDIIGVKNFDVCATSAMREASNSKEIVARVKNEIGMDLRIISGEEEAFLIRNISNINSLSTDGMKLFIDVGGGSTELSLNKGETSVNAESFDVGTLRKDDEKEDNERKRMHEWLMQYEDSFDKLKCICSGGNVSKLYKLFGNKGKNSISARKPNKAIKELSRLSVDERMKKYDLREDRADVILPAAETIKSIPDTVRSHEVLVSRYGLVDGLIVNMFNSQFT